MKMFSFPSNNGRIFLYELVCVGVGVWGKIFAFGDIAGDEIGTIPGGPFVTLFFGLLNDENI
jgi:hypothetical protein